MIKQIHQSIVLSYSQVRGGYSNKQLGNSSSTHRRNNNNNNNNSLIFKQQQQLFKDQQQPKQQQICNFNNNNNIRKYCTSSIITLAIEEMAPNVKSETDISNVNNIHTLLFDLDNTLYPKSCGLAAQVSTRITQYMSSKLGMPEKEVDQIRNHYYKTYGLTLKGLQIDHQIDIHHYLDYVHGGLDLKKHIGRDDRLVAILSSISPNIKKVIFSNADLGHCNRVTKELGIDSYFDATLEYLELLDFSKPHPVSYEMAMKKAGTSDAAGCVFFDDVVENLVGAKNAGMITVLVGSTSDDKSVDYCINEIHELTKIFPHIILDANKQ